MNLDVNDLSREFVRIPKWDNDLTQNFDEVLAYGSKTYGSEIWSHLESIDIHSDFKDFTQWIDTDRIDKALATDMSVIVFMLNELNMKRYYVPYYI